MKNGKSLLAVLLAVSLAGITLAQEHAEPQFLRISQKVAMGLIKHRVEPEYPQDARARHIQGQVVVRYLIDKKGNTAGVLATEGNPLLRDAAVAAVKQWKFKPYLLNGAPVQVETNATVEFKLGQPGPPLHFRVSQGVAERNIVKKVPPSYPLEAKENNIEGDVLLSGTIDTEGNMVDLKPVSGDPLLVQAALQAVKRWKYKPFMLNGRPVAVETNVKIRFRL